MKKHLETVPSLVVLFFDYDWNDPLWKDKQMECVDKIKAARFDIFLHWEIITNDIVLHGKQNRLNDFIAENVWPVEAQKFASCWCRRAFLSRPARTSWPRNEPRPCAVPANSATSISSFFPLPNTFSDTPWGRSWDYFVTSERRH